MIVHGYGLLVGIAIAVGWWWTERQAIRFGLAKSQVDQAGFWLIGCGLVGARLYHVVDYWDYYAADPIRILWVWQGGLAIWGAIVGGVIGGLVWARGRWTDTVSLLDAVATVMPLSQAIGRVGNWVNGELYGRQGLPLFAIEAGLNLLLFWWINYRLKLRFRGQAMGAYLMGYGLIRMCLEPLRIDPWMVGGLPVALWFSLGAVIMGAGLYFLRGRDDKGS